MHIPTNIIYSTGHKIKSCDELISNIWTPATKKDPGTKMIPQHILLPTLRQETKHMRSAAKYFAHIYYISRKPKLNNEKHIRHSRRIPLRIRLGEMQGPTGPTAKDSENIPKAHRNRNKNSQAQPTSTINIHRSITAATHLHV